MRKNRFFEVITLTLILCVSLCGCSLINDIAGTGGDSSNVSDSESSMDQAFDDRIEKIREEAEMGSTEITDEVLSDAATEDSGTGWVSDDLEPDIAESDYSATEASVSDEALTGDSQPFYENSSEVSTEEEQTTFVTNGSDTNINVADTDIELVRQQMDGLYAYEHLTEEGQIIYAQVYLALTCFYQKVYVSTLREDDLDYVFKYVLIDHPEIFYTSGYSVNKISVNGTLQELRISPTFTYDMEEVNKRYALIDEYEETCFAGIPSDADEYTKVKYIYDYIVNNTEYSIGATDNQNICSVFMYGKSVCNGYAKATQYLLNDLGIECVFVDGKANAGGSVGNHAWNFVKVDGQYYYLDSTWGDASFQDKSGENADLKITNYSYLCCTTEDISKTHVFNDTLPLPECNSMDANYYVREGLYFTSSDMNKVAELFDKCYENGSDNVTIKCSSSDVYTNLSYMLFTDKQVFNYLRGTGESVSYTTIDSQNLIIIWL